MPDVFLTVQLLLGGLVAMNFIFPSKYWEFLIIPIDEVIFFRGVACPHQADDHHDRPESCYSCYGCGISSDYGERCVSQHMVCASNVFFGVSSPF